MKESIFFDCLKTKQDSGGKPFWASLGRKYLKEGYKNGEHLRSSFKNEMRRRIKLGQFDGNIDIGEENTSYEEGYDFINIVCASKRIMSQDDIIKQFNIDSDIWEIQSFRVKTSEGYRKDRKVEWEVRDGVVLHGSVKDTGKMLVVPLYHIEVRLTKKIRVAKAKNAIAALIEDAKKFAPKYPTINYKKHPDGHLYEIDMPDIHFGRLSWDEESRDGDYDIKIAKECVDSVIDQLLSYSKIYNIEKILFPFGNDFYNSDNILNTTTRGTPQDEDTRWKKTFTEGRKLAISMIDKCLSIAPVDLLIIPGNHDQQRTFYLGEALECWYHHQPSVNIDNSPNERKYYLYGENLIGFAHGYSEKLSALPMLMALEEPEKWAKSQYREFHTGDKHNKKDMVYKTDEGNGLPVRILRSLAPADAWTFSKGYKSLKAGEAFLWHPKDNLVGQFTASPKID